MPPTLVRPQTFDPTSRFHKLGKPQHGSTSLQSPDFASPAIRKKARTKYLFSLRPSGLCKFIALSAFPSLPTFLRRRGNRELRLLGCLSPLSGWVNDQGYCTTFLLHELNWRSAFPEWLSLGETPSVYTPRPIGKPRVSTPKKR